MIYTLIAASHDRKYFLMNRFMQVHTVIASFNKLPIIIREEFFTYFINWYPIKHFNNDKRGFSKARQLIFLPSKLIEVMCTYHQGKLKKLNKMDFNFKKTKF